MAELARTLKRGDVGSGKTIEVKNGFLTRARGRIGRIVNPPYSTPDGEPLRTHFYPDTENHPLARRLPDMFRAVGEQERRNGR